MIYYIADIHLRDESIFIKCKRPYNDIFEYEKELILRWNKKVTPFDTVYVLGDIALEGCTEAIDIFSKLNGHKHLIIGNHDENLSEYIKRSGLFDSVNFISLISDAGRKVCLCHYSLMEIGWSLTAMGIMYTDMSTIKRLPTVKHTIKSRNITKIS